MLKPFERLDSARAEAVNRMLRWIDLLSTILKMLLVGLFTSLVGATVDSELYHNHSPWAPLAGWLTALVVVAWLIRGILRYIARDKLWSAFSQSVASIERSTTLNEVLAGEVSNVDMRPSSLIAAGASLVSSRFNQVFLIDKTPVTTAEVEAIYTVTGQFFKFVMRDSLQLSLRLRVFSFRTPQYMPHLFITTRRNSRYRLKSKNIGLIDERLPKKLKFQDLEGDFSRYFDIYSANKKAIDILRIMTPDVMIVLRDHGIDFDLEIIDNRTYLYIEPSVISPSQLELIISQLNLLVQSFADEMARNKFYDHLTQNYIPAKTTGFYGSIIAARFSLVVGGYLAFTLTAILIGDAIAFLYR